MSEKLSTDSLVRSDALLADANAACPCHQCAYDWDYLTICRRPGGRVCPFKTEPEKMCKRRAAWERWQKWTLHILEVMFCFKVACEETKSANKVISKEDK